jgi:hypothetical protein
MTRVEIPLAFRKLTTTGDKVLRAELGLELRTNQNTWTRLPFLFDSGTEMTTMPAAEASRMDLPMPRRPVRGLTFHGQEARAGVLRARIVGLDLTEYHFPCYFLGDPDVPPTESKNLLGLTGVINQIRLILDGTYTLTAPNGRLIVEKYCPARGTPDAQGIARTWRGELQGRCSVRSPAGSGALRSGICPGTDPPRRTAGFVRPGRGGRSQPGSRFPLLGPDPASPYK